MAVDYVFLKIKAVEGGIHKKPKHAPKWTDSREYHVALGCYSRTLRLRGPMGSWDGQRVLGTS